MLLFVKKASRATASASSPSRASLLTPFPSPPGSFHSNDHSYREKGREVKHEGDRTRRDGIGPSANRLATLQQADAVMIYVFSYWCDDQATKQTNVSNWKAIFGLLTFVKSTAEKAGMTIVVGLWYVPFWPSLFLTRPKY